MTFEYPDSETPPRLTDPRELLIQQYREVPGIRALVNALSVGLRDLDEVYHDLLLRRWIDTAEGETLDIIGRIVGIDRPFAEIDPDEVFTFDNPSGTGLGFSGVDRPDVGGIFIGLGFFGADLIDDIRFRVLIRAQIIRNTTRATIDDIVEYTQFLFGGNATVIESVGFVDVTIDRPLTRFEARILDETIPVAAGIGLRIRAFALGDEPFGFAGNTGNSGFGGVSEPQDGSGFVGLIQE